MRFEAPRPTLTLAAGGVILLALVLQLALGHQFGEGAGMAAEIAAWGLYAVAVVLLLAPFGRPRALLAGLLGFMMMAWAVHLNARFSTYLDAQFGGAQALSAQRVAVMTLFIGPVLGLIVGVVTGLLARLEVIRWRGRTYSS